MARSDRRTSDGGWRHDSARRPLALAAAVIVVALVDPVFAQPAPQFPMTLPQAVQYAITNYPAIHDSADLITNQELVAIQTIWYRDFIFDQKVSEYYKRIYSSEIDMKDHNQKLEKEEQLLRKACNGKEGEFELIRELLILQKNKSLMSFWKA